MTFIKFTISEEILLPPDLLEQNVFNSAPKIWLKYIQKFQHKFLSMLFSRDRQIFSLHQTIQLFHHEAKIFYHRKTVTKTVKKQKTVTKTVKKHRDHDNEYQCSLECVTLFSPLGTSFRKGFHVELFCLLITWQWYLHKHLNLNLTIHYIYFSSGRLDTCQFGCLRLDSKTNTACEYCGIHPTIIYYSPYQHSSGCLHVMNHVAFAMNLTYSVIDSNRTFSLKPKSHELFKSDLTVHFIKTKKRFSHLLVQIEKFKMIKIKVREKTLNQMRIYDGPGILSGLLNPTYYQQNEAFYETSLFQCTIYLFLPVDMLFLPKNIFHYSGKSKLFHNVTLSDDFLVVNYPENQNCKNKTICILRIHTQVGFFIKIEILEMTYIGSNSTQCRYAVLSVYDTKNSNTELSDVCRSQDDEYIHRYIYSTSNSVLAIFYMSAKFVTSFSLKCSISRTICKAVTINACKLNTYYVNDGECQIVQLTYSGDFTCKITIGAWDMKLQGKHIHYNVTGFLRRLYHLSQQHKAFQICMLFLRLLFII